MSEEKKVTLKSLSEELKELKDSLNEETGSAEYDDSVVLERLGDVETKVAALGRKLEALGAAFESFVVRLEEETGGEKKDPNESRRVRGAGKDVYRTRS